MYRGTVMIMDAVNSVLLMDLSMQDCSISGSGNALHSNFSKCPDIEYLKMAKELLHTLELPNIWNEELSFYSSLLKVNRDTLDNEISSGSCKYFKIHNTDEISSQKPEKSEPVVESNYFVKSRTVSENDDNLDEILDIDSFMNSDKSLNDSNLENNIKLKNSLQKFSNMRAKNSVNILGPITGKRKRVYNRKPKKSIDDNVSKKIKTTNKKKTNQVNHTEKSDESDFDAFVDQSKDLKGVPSVNDIFTEIGINYESFSDDESEKNSNKISESYNENTEKEYDNVDKVTAVVEVHNENNKNNVNSLKSPVSDKTVSKLKGFSFKSTKIINNEGCDKSICISDKPSKKSDKLNLKAKTNSSSSHSSQISIFEDEDDNYDVLNDL